MLRTFSHPNWGNLCPNWTTEICLHCRGCPDCILRQPTWVSYSSQTLSLWFWCSGKPGDIWVTCFPSEERQAQFSSKKSEIAVLSLQCSQGAGCLTSAHRDEGTLKLGSAMLGVATTNPLLNCCLPCPTCTQPCQLSRLPDTDENVEV